MSGLVLKLDTGECLSRMLPYKNTDNLIHPDGSLSLIIETILSHRLRVPVAICHSLSGVFFDSRCTSQFGRTPTTLIHAPSPTPHLASLSHFQLHQKDPTGFSTIPVLHSRTRSLVSRHPRSYFFPMAPEPDIRRGGAGRTRVLPIMTDRTTPFFCPFCPTRKFYYLHAVHDHFMKKHCATYCPRCHFDFGNCYELVNHFQQYYKHVSQPAVISGNFTSSAISQASHATQASQASKVIQVSQLSARPPQIQYALQDFIPRDNASSVISQVRETSQVSQLSPQKLPIQSTQPAPISGDFAPSVTSQVREASQASQLSPQQPPTKYTQLAPEEHELALQELLARCHSPNRLRRQNFTMPVLTDSLELSTMLPGIDDDRNGSTQPGEATGPRGGRRQGGSNGAPRPKRPGKKTALPRGAFKCTPQSQPAWDPAKRMAVALDCEMVETRTSHSELAYLSAVDFLTGEVLIDSFVVPTGTVLCWRTKTSGINADNMGEAMRSGKALRGWPAARDKLWEFINDQTVLVGHALENDLQVLGIFHPRIVDSSIVTAQAVFSTIQPNKRFPRVWGLRRLAKALLNRDIQQSVQGHSALEDAYAARDIVLCAIRSPNILAEWALVAREEEKRRQQERERMVEARRRKRKEEEQKQIEEQAPQSQAQVAVRTILPANRIPGPANSSYGRANFTNNGTENSVPRNLPQPMPFHSGCRAFPLQRFVPTGPRQPMPFQGANHSLFPAQYYVPTGPRVPLYFLEANSFPIRRSGPLNPQSPTFLPGGYGAFQPNR